MQVTPLLKTLLKTLTIFCTLAAFLCLSGILAAVPAKADTGVQGWWMTADGKAAIMISPCGAQLCGKVEWLRVPLDAAGKPKTDIHNPDATLRPRPVCGLTMLGGFSENNDGSWGGGWIYDPESGNTYKSNMHVADDGTLHVRGFIGVPLFGRSEIMTRPATPPQPCAPG